ncbi:MAG TPA: DUF4259 domain-containing protein [Tepidisphaeraceae bacterium]|jgi:hypothetical protein|nr:DUF4259 domain-containing protein [Tepidisphaeraceae bacterium]
MGTWGPGVYENDMALDWVGDLVASVTEAIEKDIDEFDESNGDQLLAAIDTIRLLCEHGRGVPPKPADISRWGREYVRGWQAYIVNLDPKPGFIDARREVIDRVLERLSELAEAFWKRP